MDRIDTLRTRIGELTPAQRLIVAAPFLLIFVLIWAVLRPDPHESYAQPLPVGSERQRDTPEVTVADLEPGYVEATTTKPQPSTTLPAANAPSTGPLVTTAPRAPGPGSVPPRRYGVDTDASTRATPPPNTPIPANTPIRAVTGSGAGVSALGPTNAKPPTVTIPGHPGTTVLDVDARANGMDPAVYDQVLALGVDVVRSEISGVDRNRFVGYFGGLDEFGERLIPVPVQCLEPVFGNSGLYATKYAGYAVVIIAWTCPGLDQEHVSEQLLHYDGERWKPVHPWEAPPDVTAGLMT